MYKLMVQANDFGEMRTKLLEAANALSGHPLIVSQKVKDEIDKHQTELPIDKVGTIPEVLYRHDIPSVPTTTRTATETKELSLSQFQEPQPTNVAESSTDSRGIPWDARVHSATKGINRDGTWRTRRGVDNKTLLEIESQLVPKTTPIKTETEKTTDVATPMIPPVPPTTVVVSTPNFNASIAPVASVVVPTEPPQYENIPIVRNYSRQVHDLKSFKETLIESLAKLVKEGKITPEYVTTLRNYFGVKEIWQVNDVQLAEMFEQFATAGLITKVEVQ